MTCHDDKILNRCHPLLPELGRYNYTPILSSPTRQNEIVPTQMVSNIIPSHSITGDQSSSLDISLCNHQSGDRGVLAEDGRLQHTDTDTVSLVTESMGTNDRLIGTMQAVSSLSNHSGYFSDLKLCQLKKYKM